MKRAGLSLMVIFVAFVSACNGDRAVSKQDLTAAPVQPAAAAPQDSSNLIKVGSQLPRITLSSIEGTKIDLVAEAKAHKALLLNFWFYT